MAVRLSNRFQTLLAAASSLGALTAKYHHLPGWTCISHGFFLQIQEAWTPQEHFVWDLERVSGGELRAFVPKGWVPGLGAPLWSVRPSSSCWTSWIGQGVLTTVQRAIAHPAKTPPSVSIPSCLHGLPNEQLHRDCVTISKTARGQIFVMNMNASLNSLRLFSDPTV